jgi:hypothetical protein
MQMTYANRKAATPAAAARTTERSTLDAAPVAYNDGVEVAYGVLRRC